MLKMDSSATVDDLEQDLLAREAMISRLRQQQADLLALLDAMQVDQTDGCRSLQEWTRSRLDVSAQTARDLVDAARSLPGQPEIGELAEESHQSFERLVATLRLAASGADKQAIADSFGYDLAGVARLKHRHQRITRNTERDIYTDRYVYLQDSLDGARGRFGGELPGYEFRIFAKALQERADMFADLPGPNIARPQRMADAVVSIAQDSLELTTTIGEPTGRSEPLATVLVDGNMAAATAGEAGAEIEFGPRVGPVTLERILCTGRVQVVGMANGKPVATSDRTRAIPPAVRRFVAWRDGGCTIDGCHSRYRLQPHHIKSWASGGNHDPDNLATLCWFHHHVVAHGLGHRLDPDTPPQRRRFLRNRTSGTDPP